MVSCPFNGREGSKCFVTARRWMRVTLLALGRRPSLGWRSWRCYSSLIMTLDDIGDLVGPITWCMRIPLKLPLLIYFFLHFFLIHLFLLHSHQISFLFLHSQSYHFFSYSSSPKRQFFFITQKARRRKYIILKKKKKKREREREEEAHSRRRSLQQ